MQIWVLEEREAGEGEVFGSNYESEEILASFLNKPSKEDIIKYSEHTLSEEQLKELLKEGSCDIPEYVTFSMYHELCLYTLDVIEN